MGENLDSIQKFNSYLPVINKHEVIVSVIMITHSHEKYIAQAIEGILLQECDFEIELIIANDSSPDNTDNVVQKIIKETPKASIIKYFSHQKNIGMMANFAFALEKGKGKYIAICDGDDFWIDPFKLQKQINFLETNTDYALCHTNYVRNINGILRNDYHELQLNTKEVYSGLIKATYPISTLTTVFRKQLWKEYIEDINPINKGWLMADLPFWIYLSKKHKVHYLDEITAVYRVLEESASNTKQIDKMIQFDKSVQEVKLFFLNRYKNSFVDEKKIRKEIEAIFIYRKIIAFAACKGNLKDFFSILFEFYKVNTNLRYFLGTFKQIFIRFS